MMKNPRPPPTAMPIMAVELRPADEELVLSGGRRTLVAGGMAAVREGMRAF